MRAGAAMRELSLRHPFTVQLACTDEPGRLTIRVVFLGVLSEAQVDDWVTHLDETFFALALAGGLGGVQFEPGLHEHPFDCEVRTDHSAPGTLIEWAVRDIHIAAEAVRVLANLCEFHMYDVPEHPIMLLDVQYAGLGRLSPTPEFPAAWPDCPFDVEEFPIEDEDFDVEIVLESPLLRDQVPALSGPLGAWLSTVVEGGFGGHPYDPARPGAQWNQKLSASAGRSIVLHVQQFYASPDALAALKNVLVAVHRAGVRIAQVVIAE